MTLDLAGRTHVGLKRSENQDEILARVIGGGDSNLACLAVADGMGGHQRGREASQMAIESITAGLERLVSENGSSPTEEWCMGLEADAHSSVQTISSDGEVTGTTLTFALVNGTDCLIGHVGDSRVYCVRGGQWDQITEDQTWEAYAEKHGTKTTMGRRYAKRWAWPGSSFRDLPS